MYTPEFKNILTSTLDGLRAEGLYKEERFIASQQYSQVTLKDGRSVINMCANNYLGLANNPEVMEAAKKAIDQWGFGMASVRFICGTQTLHRQLEERLTQFLGTEDTILFPSCFDANGGLFEGLLTADDAIISDSLNHASIIDGVRLCKAKRFRYANNDMADLEAKLQEADAAGARVKLISTDGVFSMDGIIAQLDKIHELAAKYNAIVHFDDCHATGFLGEKGRGTHEYRGLFGHIDITTGTLGKSTGRRFRRLRLRPEGSSGCPAPEGAPVPVLQQRGPGYRSRFHQSAGPVGTVHGSARPRRSQYQVFP